MKKLFLAILLLGISIPSVCFGGELTQYIDTDVAGGTGDGSSWVNAYSGYNLWEDQNLDLTDNGGDILVVYCRGLLADTTVHYLQDWTTSSTNYVYLIGDNDTGKASTTHYRLSSTSQLRVYCDAKFKNIEFEKCPIYLFATGTPMIQVEGCIIHGQTATGGILDRTSGVVSIINNVIYGIRTAGVYGINVNETSTLYVYNNTISSCTRGMQATGDGVKSIKNNISYNNTLDYNISAGGGSLVTDHNLSKDASSPDVSYRSKTLTFENIIIGSEDYNLVVGDTDAIDMGVDISTDTYIPFSTDIRNLSRPYGTAWDIGASEYTVVVSTSHPPTPQGFSGTVISSTSIDWYWVDLSTETGYLVYDDSDILKQTLSADTTFWLETGLTEGTLYSRYIKGAYDAEASTASITVSTTTTNVANTYYISPTGNDTSGDGTTGNPYATIIKVITVMSGGDTLICKNGTYYGTDNQITATQKPPVGSDGNWTIIKAENDGDAIFDGEHTRAMVTVQYVGNNDIVSPTESCANPLYYQFEGLLWANQGGGSSPQFVRTNHMKFLKCGTYDTADGGNSNFNMNRCADVLLENCYSYGSGRYKYLIYASTRIVLRQCVGRMDKANPENEVIAVFSMYSVVNAEVQNCIAIDSDQNDAYVDVESRSGSFSVPSTDADADLVNFRQCIAMNNSVGGLFTTGNNYYARNILFDNCAVIDVTNIDGNNINHFEGIGSSITQCSFLYGATTDARGFNADGGEDTLFHNNIVSNYSGLWALIGISTCNYNNVYDSTSTETMSGAGIWIWCNGSGSYGDKGANTQQINPFFDSSTNPLGAIISSNCVVTNSGNNLETAGEGGVQIGANCSSLVGTTGTMWGESGYATDTGNPMFPFPQEDLIKSKMQLYSSGTVTGNRGFASSTAKQLDGTSDVTLSSYIQEYLGNQYTPTPTPPTPSSGEVGRRRNRTRLR